MNKTLVKIKLWHFFSCFFYRATTVAHVIKKCGWSDAGKRRCQNILRSYRSLRWSNDHGKESKMQQTGIAVKQKGMNNTMLCQVWWQKVDLVQVADSAKWSWSPPTSTPLINVFTCTWQTCNLSLPSTLAWMYKCLKKYIFARLNLMPIKSLLYSEKIALICQQPKDSLFL